jgi:hypothetical protein
VQDWLVEMKAQVDSKAGRAKYKLRQQTVEPVFGIIKEVLGFRRFHLRSLAGVNLEWFLITFAYNCKRLHKLQVLHHLNIAAWFPLLYNLRKLSPTGC